MELYEARPLHAPSLIQSGIVLTPNGLRILDTLGILSRIQSRCYIATHRTFKNNRDETLRKTLVADESSYGYANHRVWRQVLLDEMKLMLQEQSVVIHYDSKFSSIVTDDPSSGVTFLINSIPCQASLLIGSDGIYSSVRDYLSPGVVPEYTGTIGILAHIHRRSVSWPYPDYERNATIQDVPGALFFIPEDPEAEEIMIGFQIQYPQQSRSDLEHLQRDKEKLLSFFRKDYSRWGETARKIIDAVSESKESLYIWPYLRMPRLECWYSGSGQVVIVGDGAHALPPSSGQGVNQVLEDVYTLALLLNCVGIPAAQTSLVDCKHEVRTTEHKGALPRGDLPQALSFWQSMRQARIDAVYDWATNATNVQRLPEAERRRLIEEGKVKPGKVGERDDMTWLYAKDLAEDVQAWKAKEAPSSKHAQD